MPQKSKGHQQMERLFGPWKQELLDEARDLILADLDELQAEMKRFSSAQEELKEREESLKSLIEKTEYAARKAHRSVDHFTGKFSAYMAFSAVIGGLFGGLLMWFFLVVL
jgi:DNA repair exonuclease SbcCD ATPase subunit